MSELAAAALEQPSNYRDVYDLGSTVIYASKADPRFSFCLYVPPTLAQNGPAPELIVAMHGTSRFSFLEFRDAFAEFGRWNNCIILCPLFPVGVCGDDNRNGYKLMYEADIRYDKALLDMVEQVSGMYGMAFEKFALFGYSGGGQFAHRFYILHPEKLWAVSIGASGSVTLLDTEKQWWVGVGDLAERFGRTLNIPAMREVDVHMVVGDADLETWEITHRPGGKLWMEGANDAGATRPERLKSLQRSFEANGIDVQFDLVNGVSHDRLKCVGKVKEFFHTALTRRRSAN